DVRAGVQHVVERIETTDRSRVRRLQGEVEQVFERRREGRVERQRAAESGLGLLRGAFDSQRGTNVKVAVAELVPGLRAIGRQTHDTLRVGDLLGSGRELGIRAPMYSTRLARSGGPRRSRWA